jgi:hypothetical protein
MRCTVREEGRNLGLTEDNEGSTASPASGFSGELAPVCLPNRVRGRRVRRSDQIKDDLFAFYTQSRSGASMMTDLLPVAGSRTR